MRVEDQAAWDALVDGLGPSLWAAARGRGLTVPDASEVFQLAWLRLADHLDDIDGQSEVGAWLHAVVHDEATRGAAGTPARSLYGTFGQETVPPVT